MDKSFILNLALGSALYTLFKDEHYFTCFILLVGFFINLLV